jgi:hypothetical protein
LISLVLSIPALFLTNSKRTNPFYTHDWRPQLLCVRGKLDEEEEQENVILKPQWRERVGERERERERDNSDREMN